MTLIFSLLALYLNCLNCSSKLPEKLEGIWQGKMGEPDSTLPAKWQI